MIGFIIKKSTKRNQKNNERCCFGFSSKSKRLKSYSMLKTGLAIKIVAYLNLYIKAAKSFFNVPREKLSPRALAAEAAI
jgi:hypothetical protein